MRHCRRSNGRFEGHPMDDDYRSPSGGIATLLVVLLVVVLIIALGGGGVMYVASLRYQAAAQRAEAEAALQAQRAAEESREELALRAAQARDPAAKDTAPAAAPAGPLEQVNNAFRAAYKSARQDALIGAGPVVVVSGDDLVLHRAGKRTSLKVVPPLYHDLKAYSHIPLAAYLLTRPGIDADRRAELTMFLNQVEVHRDNARSQLTDEQRGQIGRAHV